MKNMYTNEQLCELIRRNQDGTLEQLIRQNEGFVRIMANRIYTSSGDFLHNPTGIQAKPLITITGSGDINLLVGTQIIQLNGIEGGIILDSELQEAYWGDALKNSCMTGEFPVLSEGNTAVSWTGGNVTSVSVTPRWVSM